MLFRAKSRFPNRQLFPALVATFTLFAAPARANAVDDWAAIAYQVVIVNAGPAGAGHIDFAYVHIAIYDAVNAIDRSHTVFAVRPTTPTHGASPDAATAAAAYTMLKSLYPAQQAYLDGTYLTYLLNIPDGPAKTRGIAVGIEVANALRALRTGDGYKANVPYVFGAGPGVYQATPGGTPTPLNPWLAALKPFAIESAVQFRADGPPNLTSARWAEDYNRTKAYGALTGSLRSPEQTEIGLFYAENPNAQTNRNIRLIALAQHFSLADSARFFAQLYVTLADAQITTWNSKYFYNFWRPVTAIRAGDTDDNPGTDADLAWLPLVVTPSHPEYPAAHPAISGALAYALGHFFGTQKINVTLTSTSVPGVALAEHHFDTVEDMVRDVINARIYGGMHYRTSGVDGAVIGKKVARYVSKHYFRPVD
jgi:hypothetical protein